MSNTRFQDSFLVDGVAFKKTFSYAGFEQQPKKFTNPKILCLNIELELKSEKENAEIRIEDPEVCIEVARFSFCLLFVCVLLRDLFVLMLFLLCLFFYLRNTNRLLTLSGRLFTRSWTSA